MSQIAATLDSVDEGQTIVFRTEGRVIGNQGNDVVVRVESPEGRPRTHILSKADLKAVVHVRQQPKDFPFGSVIWVEVKGQPGTEEVVVVKNAAGERRYRSILHPHSYQDYELGSVTGVPYKAIDFSEDPF
ncbi:hypothetical protein [Kineococcus sp. NPDC059986]|uniref:hypothetical protein n=1 Tax=Actinomycetes TaxID=1760 RepID=UPI00344C9EA1